MPHPQEMAAFSDSHRLTVRHSSFYSDHWRRSRHHIPLGDRSWQAAIGCGYEPSSPAHFSGTCGPLHSRLLCCLLSRDEQQCLSTRRAKRSASFFWLPVRQGFVDLSMSRGVLVPTRIRPVLVPTRQSGFGTQNTPQWDSLMVLLARLRS